MIGLLAWISLFAQLFLLAAEVNVVRVRRLDRLVELSPARGSRGPRRSAEEERALPQERVDVHFQERSGRADR